MIIRPFSNGAEYSAWLADNCDQCWRSGNCLMAGALSAGAIPEHIARQLGLCKATNWSAAGTTCPERETRAERWARRQREQRDRGQQPMFEEED